jgi:hypothetical protein
MAGAAVIGANCGHGIAGYVPICQRLRAASSLPVWIKPNAGLPSMVEGHAVYTTTAAEFSSYLPQLAITQCTMYVRRSLQAYCDSSCLHKAENPESSCLDGHGRRANHPSHRRIAAPPGLALAVVEQ